MFSKFFGLFRRKEKRERRWNGLNYGDPSPRTEEFWRMNGGM